jgi:hypothetical protein
MFAEKDGNISYIFHFLIISLRHKSYIPRQFSKPVRMNICIAIMILIRNYRILKYCHVYECDYRRGSDY